jgi:GMP synthase-like glutamine amidotransferase
VPSGLFGETVRNAGHSVYEYSFALGPQPPTSLDGYDAVMVFGGPMNVNEEAEHPWIRTEIDALRRMLVARIPVLGVCLGGQLLAVAAGAEVGPTPEPEIGWYDVELTRQAAHDPLFAGLPTRFTAYEWHGYQFTLPNAAVPLARSHLCLQAYRIGDCAWGMLFHAEVTEEIVMHWIDAYGSSADVEGGSLDTERVRAELERNIERWNAVGRTLCRAFLASAEARAEAECGSSPSLPRI